MAKRCKVAQYDLSTQPLPGSVTAHVKCELSVKHVCSV